jgi:hypothetical protein
MRNRMTRQLRRWGATLMVAAYAFGVLAPTVAFARADHASIVHVLTESHGGVLVLHFHEDDGDHHGLPAKPGSHRLHHCCGVVSLPGLEPSTAVSVLPPQQTVTLVPAAERLLSGCGCARLERPPKSS